MPAPTTPQVGIEFLLKVAATLIGGCNAGTLKITPEVEGVVHKGAARFQRRFVGTRQWEITYGGLYLAGGAEVSSLALTLDANTLAAVKKVSLDLALETAARADESTAGWRVLSPTTRSVEIAIEGNYIDPAAAGQTALSNTLTDLLTPASDTETAAVLSLGDVNLSGAFKVSDFQMSQPVADFVPYTLALQSHGAIALDGVGTTDAGLAALLNAIFANAPTALTALIEVQDAALAGALAGATQYTGSVYPTSLKLEFETGKSIKMSGTLMGSGALNKAAQV